MLRLFMLGALCALACEPALAQDQQAAEGRGLLPEPSTMPTTLGGSPPPHPFVSDPSGGFSRTIFETDDDPNFKLIIRDFSFPPDRHAHTIVLPAAAVLHALSEPGEISVANRRVALSSGARMTVSPAVPIEIVNKGEYPMVVRALVLEAK